MHDGEETDTMVEAFRNVFRYKLRSTVSGVWVLFQKATIPSGVVKPSKDDRYAERVLRHLLNVNGLYSFLSEISVGEWKQLYGGEAIMSISDNVAVLRR